MWGWERYVPVAERLREAKKQIAQLKKKGKIKVIEPVEIEGKAIAKKFWGKRWCEYLESFADFENRLPRGRTYARNGSICHLEIQKGIIKAFVSGSSLYTVEVQIATLQKDLWQTIKDKCSGQIGSMLELLKGTLSDQVMDVVTDSEKGLFPKTKEIHYSCNCPDWADMCKHVAAVLYGIGARLDERPELLFLLRGVDAQELITTKLTTHTTKTDDLLEDKDLHELFDIELDDKLSIQKKKTSKTNMHALTGKKLKKIRLKMHLNPKEFARKLGVTPESIYRWERTEGRLSLRDDSLSAIQPFLG
jgi:uncharacterized Zn finger protein